MTPEKLHELKIGGTDRVKVSVKRERVTAMYQFTIKANNRVAGQIVITEAFPPAIWVKIAFTLCQKLDEMVEADAPMEEIKSEFKVMKQVEIDNIAMAMYAD